MPPIPDPANPVNTLAFPSPYLNTTRKKNNIKRKYINQKHSKTPSSRQERLVGREGAR
jgi:hypothetical protein